jgi:hypothetical protein
MGFDLVWSAWVLNGPHGPHYPRSLSLYYSIEVGVVHNADHADQADQKH